MPGNSIGHQSDAGRQFFRSTNTDLRDSAVLDCRAAAFGHRKFGVNRIKMLIQHEVYTDAGNVSLFAGFCQKDDVAVQRHTIALKQ